MSPHTRTPWEVHEPRPGDGGAGPQDFTIVGDVRPADPDEEGDTGSCVVVAHVRGNPTAGGIPAANAREIVRRVNAHDALVAALKGVLAAWLTEAGYGDGILEQHGPALDAARAALAAESIPTGE